MILEFITGSACCLLIVIVTAGAILIYDHIKHRRAVDGWWR